MALFGFSFTLSHTAVPNFEIACTRSDARSERPSSPFGTSPKGETISLWLSGHDPQIETLFFATTVFATQRRNMRGGSGQTFLASLGSIKSRNSRAPSALDGFEQEPVSHAVTDARCKELGGKLIGQPTRIMREHFKLGVEEECDELSRGQRVLRGAKHALYAPVRLYLHIAYSCRPSITSKEAREAQWAALHSPTRYLLSLMVGFGPPSYFFFNIRYPLALVTLLIVWNCVYETLEALYPALPEFATTQIWDIFRQGTFAISVVLGFKVNQVYQRFWLARQAYGGLCGNLNALAQLMHLYADSMDAIREDEEEKRASLDEINRYCVCYAYALIMQLLTLDHLPSEARHLVRVDDCVHD